MKKETENKNSTKLTPALVSIALAILLRFILTTDDIEIFINLLIVLFFLQLVMLHVTYANNNMLTFYFGLFSTVGLVVPILGYSTSYFVRIVYIGVTILLFYGPFCLHAVTHILCKSKRFNRIVKNEDGL